jgi:hypothetical protein
MKTVMSVSLDAMANVLGISTKLNGKKGTCPSGIGFGLFFIKA